MQFRPTGLSGAWLVVTEPFEDARGRFGRIYCEREFAAHQLVNPLVQASLSFNHKRGTVRGMHFQWPPSREAKLIRCVRGAVFDAIVDLRPESESFLGRFTVELSADNYTALYVPEGFAHGFQALRDASELLYQMTDFFEPELSGGFRFDEPQFAIPWPEPPVEVSDRDRTATPFDSSRYIEEYSRRQRTGRP
jgi:dTDP-4-dehydrorhamnose 3,5-epimerase